MVCIWQIPQSVFSITYVHPPNIRFEIQYAEHDQLDKILVSKAEKVDGEYVQKIQFFYRLLYNKPSEYAQLVLGGEVEHYPSLSYDNSKLEDWLFVKHCK